MAETKCAEDREKELLNAVRNAAKKAGRLLDQAHKAENELSLLRCRLGGGEHIDPEEIRLAESEKSQAGYAYLMGEEDLSRAQTRLVKFYRGRYHDAKGDVL